MIKAGRAPIIKGAQGEDARKENETKFVKTSRKWIDSFKLRPGARGCDS
jgi:hypothetical protein